MSKSLILHVGLALTILTACVIGSHAQEQPPKGQLPNVNHVVSDEIYDQVLDIVFPRNALAGAFGYAFVLRYKPSFGAESQIVIINDGDGIEVTEYTSSNGSIYNQLSKSARFTEDTSAEEAAKLVHVNKRTLQIPSANIERLRAGFYDYLRDASRHERTGITENRNKVSIATDGTQYLLWYRGAAQISFDSSGSNVEDPPRLNEHSLVKWMKEVRRVANNTTASIRQNYPHKR